MSARFNYVLKLISNCISYEVSELMTDVGAHISQLFPTPLSALDGCTTALLSKLIFGMLINKEKLPAEAMAMTVTIKHIPSCTQQQQQQQQQYYSYHVNTHKERGLKVRS
uniref:Uncharacterized protein n=1 Tax=Glossina palpalis gambiensis TaxID=67801 RepID=A0A1B0AVK2_9MUSC